MAPEMMVADVPGDRLPIFQSVASDEQVPLVADDAIASQPANSLLTASSAVSVDPSAGKALIAQTQDLTINPGSNAVPPPNR